MTLAELARKLRALVEKAAQSLDDADALEGVELYPAWHTGTAYTIGIRVRYGDDGLLYRCLQDHTAQDAWTPADATSLWARVLIPDPDVIPDWVQPDSTNPYSQGDKVKHGGKTWISDIDGNVWEPGVYGWTQLLDE